jgi:hypothetical protein
MEVAATMKWQRGLLDREAEGETTGLQNKGVGARVELGRCRIY